MSARALSGAFSTLRPSLVSISASQPPSRPPAVRNEQHLPKRVRLMLRVTHRLGLAESRRRRRAEMLTSRLWRRADKLGSRKASSVELIYVPALDLVELARVPHHNYVARLFWRALGVHAAFHRQAIALPRVALGARCYHVVPGVRATARDRLDVVAGQPVAAPEVVSVSRAVLATVVIAGKEDRVRHVLAQTTGYLDVLDETDHERVRILGPLGAEPAVQVRLDDLGLFGDDEDYRPLDRYQGHGLIARVERQASCHAEILT
jgi:hypothetical protein